MFWIKLQNLSLLGSNFKLHVKLGNYISKWRSEYQFFKKGLKVTRGHPKSKILGKVKKGQYIKSGFWLDEESHPRAPINRFSQANGCYEKKWWKKKWMENFGKISFKKGQTYSQKLLTEIWAVIIFLNLFKKNFRTWIWVCLTFFR